MRYWVFDKHYYGSLEYSVCLDEIRDEMRGELSMLQIYR
jgi:hypothetical protein